jgi:hypothetical protein
MEALDGFMHGLLAAAHRQQRHVGVLFVESFRSCFKHQDDCDKSCGKFEEGRQGLFNTSIAGAARKAPHMQGAIIIKLLLAGYTPLRCHDESVRLELQRSLGPG